jgi:hypothetical protein
MRLIRAGRRGRPFVVVPCHLFLQDVGKQLGLAEQVASPLVFGASLVAVSGTSAARLCSRKSSKWRQRRYSSKDGNQGEV